MSGRPGVATAVLNLDEWMGVLTLAKKWKLEDMKAKAVAGSDEEIQKKTVIDKILLAKKYGVAKWLKEGYCALASRKEPITALERGKIGWETYGRLMDVRERGRAASLDKAELDVTSAPNTHIAAIHCDTCGIKHVPFCAANLRGSVGSNMRLCPIPHCGGFYHGVGCPAGQPLTTPPAKVKDRVVAQQAAFNFEGLVLKEFGASVKV